MALKASELYVIWRSVLVGTPLASHLHHQKSETLMLTQLGERTSHLHEVGFRGPDERVELLASGLRSAVPSEGLYRSHIAGAAEQSGRKFDIVFNNL